MHDPGRGQGLRSSPPPYPIGPRGPRHSKPEASSLVTGAVTGALPGLDTPAGGPSRRSRPSRPGGPDLARGRGLREPLGLARRTDGPEVGFSEMYRVMRVRGVEPKAGSVADGERISNFRFGWSQAVVRTEIAEVRAHPWRRVAPDRSERGLPRRPVRDRSSEGGSPAGENRRFIGRGGRATLGLGGGSLRCFLAIADLGSLDPTAAD